MPYIWNIYEKSFTPYFASLAPKHLVNRHKMEKHPNRVSNIWQRPQTKTFIRFIRKYILQNNAIYLFGILLTAFTWEHLWKKFFRSIYLAKNQQHSLQYAEQKEAEYLIWRKKNHPEDFEEEEVEAEAEVAEEVDDDE